MSTQIYQLCKSTSSLELEKIEKLIDDLPHGSGINYDWSAELRARRLIVFNRFDAMDEMGGYCHVYSFQLIFERKSLKLLDVHLVGRELQCCGYGLREYLEELFYLS